KEFDCISKMRNWMIETAICTEEELDTLEKESKAIIKKVQLKAWSDYINVFETEKNEVIDLLKNLNNEATQQLAEWLRTLHEPNLKDIYGSVRKALRIVRNESSEARGDLIKWYKKNQEVNVDRFNSKLFTEGKESIASIPQEP